MKKYTWPPLPLGSIPMPAKSSSPKPTSLALCVAVSGAPACLSVIPTYTFASSYSSMKRESNGLGFCVVTVCRPVATTALSHAGSLSSGSSAGGLSVRTAANVPVGP